MQPEQTDDAHFMSYKNKSGTNNKKSVVKFTSITLKDKLMTARPKLKTDYKDVYVHDFLCRKPL